MGDDINTILYHGAIHKIQGAIDDLGTLADRTEWEDGRAYLLNVSTMLNAILNNEFGRGGLKGFLKGN